MYIILFFSLYLLNLFSSKLIYIVENLDIGFKIKKLREEKNVSQEQLVNLLEISKSKLTKIENGRLKKIEMKLVLKFCKSIDVSLDEFFENKETVDVNQ